MNDFTKEEIKMISQVIQCVIIQNDLWQNASFKPIYCTLKNKIESMIDLYDETKDWEQKMGMCDKCGRYKR